MATQITLTTELQAINTMLSIIGEAPVSSIASTTGTDVAIAKQILDETSVDVQTQGWNFNTQEDFPLALDSNNKIPVPSNAVWVTTRPHNSTKNVIIRNAFLYDKDKNTDIFSNTLKVDMIILLPFTELPQFARRYIVTTAGRRFQARYLGSKELAGFSAQDELEARVACQQLDAANEKLNILENDLSNRIMYRGSTRRYY
jgi:hypothetical protein